MSNVLTAKNSFQDGLLMDFAPENTGAGNLTNALNATLVTFNGNEMVLLNDMGNGRVETARLPEGFIPVGTCEFGDIIYIVSYNPITDKSQIGCFPSPERNISSDEISNSELSISINDFLELDEYNNPTGKLKKTSVKKVIVETKKLNPGDKYILYTENKNAITANKKVLSGYGIGSIELSPKNLKLHVVSIEDSGKITYLDTTTKWYNIDNNNDSYSDYLINYSQSSEGVHDLDSYRDLLESNWSIFSSKVSGKLAILAELETIDTFSCSYDVELINTYSDDNDITYNDYKLYLYPEYTSKHEDIKPAYIVATKSAFAGENVEGLTTKKGKNIATDSLIFEGGNVGFVPDTNKGWKLTSDGKIDTGVTFKIPYTKLVESDIPNKNEVVRIKSDALIYTMLITPAMNYGMLDHLAQDIIIDFNKIGTGEINLTTWKYHNSETTSILTFGLESHPKPNHEIKAIIMDFYDAQGLCAEYILLDKKSYNGVFTEYILLGQPTGNFRFKNKKLNTNNYINYNNNYNNLISAINILQSESTSNDEKSNSDKTLQNILIASGDPDVYVGRELLLEKAIAYRDTFISNYFTPTEDIKHYSNALYKDDAKYNEDGSLKKQAETFNWELPKEKDGISDVNTIYPNNLYKVVIKVYSARKDNKSILEIKSFKRWYWTTSMFNDYYYNCNDFEILKFQLELDANVLYFSKPNFVWKEQKINNLSTEGFEDSTWSDDNVPQTFSANKIYIGEDNNPNLKMSIQAGLINDYGCFNLYKERLSDIEVTIYLGGGNITYDNVDYNWSIEASNLLYENFLLKKPLEVNAGDTYDNIDSTNIQNKVDGLSDFYDLSFDNRKDPTTDSNSQYQYYSYTTTLDTCYYKNETERAFIDLLFKSVLYNKAYVTDLKSSKITVPVYKPVVSEIRDLQLLGLSFSELGENTRLYFPVCITLGNNEDSVMTARLNFTLSNNDLLISCNLIEKDDNVNSTTMVGNISVSNIKDLLKQTLPKKGVFFLVYPAWSKNADEQKDEFLVNLDSTEKWRSLYWVSENGGEDAGKGFKNMITSNIIDVNVNGDKIFKVEGYSQTPFLAVKVNEDTCYILNNAYASQPKSEDTITQAPIYASKKNNTDTFEEKPTLFYDNFATLLYYLFSNVYHRNCQVDNIAVNVGNIVSNNPFEATLTRDIVVSLKGKEKITHNIIFNGMDFNQYVNVVYSNINSVNPVKTGDWIKLQNINNDTQNNNNIILNFIERGVLSLLTVTKKVDSLFIGSEIPAYYYTPKKELKPLSEDLLGNTFYIRLNDTLSVYKDEEELLFNPDETCFSLPLQVTKTKLSDTLLNEYYNKYKEFYNSIKDFKLSIQIPNNGELQYYIDAYFNPDNLYNLIKDLLTETNNDNFNNYLSNSKASGKAVIINGDTSLQFPDSYYNKMGNYALFFKTIYLAYKLPEEITDAYIEITSITNSNPSTIKVTKFLGFELEEPWEITLSELEDDYKIQVINSEPINFKLKDSTEFIQINPIISGNFISFEFPDEGGVVLVTNCQIQYKNYILQFKGQDIDHSNQIRCVQNIGDNYYTPNNLDESLVQQGEIVITRADTMPNLTPIIADCVGFKCGLGLNQAFTYTNKLEATVDYGGSFGFGGDDSNGESTHDINELGTAYWINIGSKQLYLDSHFKLDNPDLPDPNYWEGIRDINTINNGNE